MKEEEVSCSVHIKSLIWKLLIILLRGVQNTNVTLGLRGVPYANEIVEFEL